MRIIRLGTVALGLGLLFTAGCGREFDQGSDVAGIQARQATRSHVVRITFSAWKDSVMIDAAAESARWFSTRPVCSMIDPSASIKDGSTRWRPMHSYWALAEPTSGQIARYDNVYFPGDSVTPASMPFTTIGLRTITDQNAQFVTINNIRMAPDRSWMTFDFAVSGISTTYKFLMRGRSDARGCAVEAFRCAAASCDSPTLAGYKAFQRIHVTQGLFGMPSGVSFQ